MKKLMLLYIIILVFIYGCGKEEIVEEYGEPLEEITAQVQDIDESKFNYEVVNDYDEVIETVRLCDDTDNGRVRWVNGTVFGFNNHAERFEYHDYCFNNNILVEYFCENEMPQNMTFLCTNGCEDNHCL